MRSQNLPKNYHRDWQRKRAAEDPAWYAARKVDRGALRRRRKIEWVAKFGGKCKDCSGVFPPEVYDFHHLDEATKTKTKHRGAGHVFMLSPAVAAKELAGCVMLCANCHRIRHIIDRRYS